MRDFKPERASEAGLSPRSRRLVKRAGRFLLTWGTPIAIGLFLGSAGGRTSRASAASSSVPARVAPPPR